MNLFHQAGFWINTLATAGSLVSSFIAIHMLWKGDKALAKRYAILFVVCVVGLVASGYFYTKHITTLTQGGDFRQYPDAINEIFYPVPYKTKPYLIVRYKDSSIQGGSVRIVEQRLDGFKVQTDSLAYLWEWRADGVPMEK